MILCNNTSYLMKRFAILLSCFASLIGCVSPQYECLFDDGVDCTPNLENQTISTSNLPTCSEVFHGTKLWEQYKDNQQWLQSPSGSKFLQLELCGTTCNIHAYQGLVTDCTYKVACPEELTRCEND